MLTIQTRSMLKALHDIRNQLHKSIAREKWSMNYIRVVSNQIWALNELEDRLLDSDEAPLIVLERFGHKMEVYSGNEEEFKDCVAILNVLYDTVIC